MAPSLSSSRWNRTPRTKSTDTVSIVCALAILFVAAVPFSRSVGSKSIGFASAFITSIPRMGSRQLCEKRAIRKQASNAIIASAAAATTTTTDDDETKKKTIWTMEQLEDYASDETINVVISFTTFGPGYRAVARAKHDESIVLGYVEGFLRPTQPRLLHLDKMEIFQPVLERVRKTHPNTLQFGGINIGLGLLMGYRCLLYASDPAQGPRTIAEFLAIDDEDFQHKRLVRYYRYAGFKIVKYVGDDPKDIPDRLVWGGCGTLMTQDIPELMAKWTTLFELMKSRVEKKQQEATKLANNNSATATTTTTTTTTAPTSIRGESESDSSETKK